MPFRRMPALRVRRTSAIGSRPRPALGMLRPWGHPSSTSRTIPRRHVAHAGSMPYRMFSSPRPSMAGPVIPPQFKLTNLVTITVQANQDFIRPTL